MNHDRSSYNKKTILLAFVSIIVGLLLIILSENIEREAHPLIYGLLAPLAGTLFTAGILGFGYEYYLRKEILNGFDSSTDEINEKLEQIISNIESKMNLTRQLVSIGLNDVCIDSSKYDYSDIIINSKKLYFVFNDGRTWFSNHTADLHKRARNNIGHETHVLLVDENSNFLESLSTKVDETVDILRTKISQTNQLLQKMQWGDNRLCIYGHKQPTSFSLIMNENLAIFIPYPMADKVSAIPCFVFHAGQETSFFEILQQDIRTLIASPETVETFTNRVKTTGIA